MQLLQPLFPPNLEANLHGQSFYLSDFEIHSDASGRGMLGFATQSPGGGRVKARVVCWIVLFSQSCHVVCFPGAPGGAGGTGADAQAETAAQEDLAR